MKLACRQTVEKLTRGIGQASKKSFIIRLKQKETKTLIPHEEKRDVTGTKFPCYPLPVPQEAREGKPSQPLHWGVQTRSSGTTQASSQGLLETMDSVGHFHLVWVSLRLLLFKNVQWVWVLDVNFNKVSAKLGMEKKYFLVWNDNDQIKLDIVFLQQQGQSGGYCLVFHRTE